MVERDQEPGAGRLKGRGDKSAEPDAGAPAPVPRRHQSASGERARPTPATARQPAGSDGGTAPVRSRAERYLVAAAPWAAAATAGQELIEALRGDPDVRTVHVVRTAKHDSPVEPLAGEGRYPPVAVVEMAPDRAMALAARPDVQVDADHLLRQGEPLPAPTPADVTAGTLGESVPVTFQVRDEHGEALPDATVYVVGGLYPVGGTADKDGTVELRIPVDSLAAVRGVYARPRTGCWSAWVGRPDLAATGSNVVICRRLSAPGGERPGAGWAHRAMGFDRLPPTYRAHGVKIAAIGTGIDASHPDLAGRVTAGVDLVGQDEKSWGEDLVGHGTHQVALIMGYNGDGSGGGVAPDADIHVCRVLPDGRIGDLIEALDYCIAQEIDVVDLAVGAYHGAGLLVQKIEEARQAGILCVAAAGDGGGPVMFPGSLPTVLTVGAIGQLGSYPPESHHATQFHWPPTPEGYFSARFSGSGPSVDLVAPGVAVVSAVPPAGYAALDSTAVASAFVTALAGLVLAHHPDFRYTFRTRGPARVDRLADLLKASCRPLPYLEANRRGAGLPDAVAAVGLVEPMVHMALAGGPDSPWLPPAGPATTLDTLTTAMRSAGLLQPPTP